MADNKSVSISVESNMSAIEESIKINESQFDSLVAQVKKRYPNFDWDKFDNLSSSVKRMVIRNYLAQMAYEEVAENFKADIKSRAKGDVVTEDYNKHTYYYNKSDDLYRKDYVTANIMAEAKKRGLLHKTEGAEWLHFKQKDVAALDKIIAEQTAKAPANMHCDKECAYPTTSIDQDWAKEYLAKWKEKIDEYENARRESLEKSKQYLAENQATYKKEIAELKEKYKGSADVAQLEKELKTSVKNTEKQIKAKEQEFVKEMVQMRKEYDDYAQRTQEIDIWRLKPYNTECEMVSVSCFNVQQIPAEHERYRLSMSKTENGYGHISYSYDDIDKNEHIEATALKNCNCGIYNKNVDNYVNCSCLISFYDEIQDFSAVRQYENLDRIDIKNGKNQDLDEDGHYKHDWPGNYIPGGYVKSRSLDLTGKYSGSDTGLEE